MKTYKNIFPRICAYDNLYFAWRDAARGKRKSPEVAAFEYALTDNLLRLEVELREGRYRPRPYRHFHITYPKPRRISAARFRDWVVHHALVRQIEPIFEARFIHDSYACRVGRGTHAALDRCQAFARRYRYVLGCDIVQFFPAVDHGILRDVLFRLIVDVRARWLINLILDSGAGVLRTNTTSPTATTTNPTTSTTMLDFASLSPMTFNVGGPKGRGPCRQSCGVTAPRRTRKTARSGPGRVRRGQPLRTGHIQNGPGLCGRPWVAGRVLSWPKGSTLRPGHHLSGGDHGRKCHQW